MYMGKRNIFFFTIVIYFLAVLGASPSKDLIAAEVCDRAFNSRTWPNKVSEIMAAVASKYTATRPIETKSLEILVEPKFQ